MVIPSRRRWCVRSSCHQSIALASANRKRVPAGSAGILACRFVGITPFALVDAHCRQDACAPERPAIRQGALIVHREVLYDLIVLESGLVRPLRRGTSALSKHNHSVTSIVVHAETSLRAVWRFRRTLICHPVHCCPFGVSG